MLGFEGRAKRGNIFAKRGAITRRLSTSNSCNINVESFGRGLQATVIRHRVLFSAQRLSSWTSLCLPGTTLRYGMPDIVTPFRLYIVSTQVSGPTDLLYKYVWDIVSVLLSRHDLPLLDKLTSRSTFY